MSIAGKVYNKMLLNRIYEPIDNMLRPIQVGFRTVRNCLEQIHILRRLLEAYHQRQLPLLATFVDFSKAFHSVDRNALFKILRHDEIPLRSLMLSQQCIQTVQVEFIVSANPSRSIQVFFKETHLLHFYLSLWLTTFSNKQMTHMDLKHILKTQKKIFQI